MKFSCDEEYLQDIEPVYEEFEGNFGDISNIKEEKICQKMQKIFK